MEQKRILIVSQHGMVRHGLRLMLNAATVHRVIDDGRPLREIEAMLAASRPDLLVVDIDHETDGLDRLQAVLDTDPAPPKLMLLWDARYEDRQPWRTAEADVQVLALARHAVAVMTSGANAAEMLHAIHQVLDGRTDLEQPQAPVDDIVSTPMALAERDHHDTDVRITPREWQVMELIRQGLCNKRIARVLDISVTTVRTHRQKLMSKLGLRNAVEVAQYVSSAGLYQSGRTAAPAMNSVAMM